MVTFLASNPVDRWLETPIAPAGGFVYPLDPGGRGPVKSTARGRVLSSERIDEEHSAVVIEHVYYENYELKHVTSHYRPLSKVTVRAGDAVQLGHTLGQLGRAPFVFSLRDGEQPLVARTFIAAHRTTFLPAEEPVLVVIDQANLSLSLYEHGRLKRSAEIALGQEKGRKRRQGDLRTPLGMYFVTEKYRGNFPGKFGAYFGGHWIKINYPNAYDAEWGVEQGLLDETRRAAIEKNWRARKLTDQRTPLGGGIGLHGWIEEWDAKESTQLSWGCVVLHLRDVAAIYDAIPIGAMVVIK